MSDQRCEQDVYDNGEQVFMTHTIRAYNVEKWVQILAIYSEQKVDWHYGAGRAFILTTGDKNKVREAIKKFKFLHDEMYMEASTQLISEEMAKESLDGIWEYNKIA